ncbi:hypothetical protein [Pannonibacter tanglangensis]|uniref:Uncharacterized protein n=1 Tax=Pannonibacter tanglangensis TaxID=2750084 RepID=A0ABW9ZE19_9HYPH|nr:hypothetical protein [Pannonibacter sp. XCT-34]NBN63087.1 hypothetical protein [Pannonibacter sp. XCT-34]
MSIKITRAAKLSRIGDTPRSFAAMAQYLPDSVIKSLTSVQLAEMIDALWTCAGDAKAIAAREAIEAGCVWDAKRNMSRDLAPLA